MDQEKEELLIKEQMQKHNFTQMLLQYEIISRSELFDEKSFNRLVKEVYPLYEQLVKGYGEDGFAYHLSMVKEQIAITSNEDKVNYLKLSITTLLNAL